METFIEQTYKAYKVVRTLEDGQRVQVGTFQDLNRAKGLVVALNEFWPGGYSIEPSGSEKLSG